MILVFFSLLFCICAYLKLYVLPSLYKLSEDEDTVTLSESDQKNVQKAIRVKEQTYASLEKKKNKPKTFDDRNDKLPPGQKLSKK